MIDEKQCEPVNVLSDDWSKAKCDKYDYMMGCILWRCCWPY